MFSTARRLILSALRKRGIQVTWMLPTLIQLSRAQALDITIEDLIARRMIEPDPNFFVLQIGANDGVRNDPLHACILRYDLAGILVEPQPRMFDALRSTHQNNPRLTLRNVAIAERDEVRPFYRVADGLPVGTTQLASFDPAVILSHDRPDLRLRENLVCEDVQCLSFESLLADVNRVDVLQIDVEGYDATLIGLFDFGRWRPGIVQFEHRHLTRSGHDAALERLVGYGYRVAVAEADTLAYLD